MKDKIKNNKPIPFYFINDKIDKGEVLRQLDLMKDCGISGIILHPRDGITETGYSTERFFQDITFIAEETIKRGLNVWLYDEDSYPSGNGGGVIAMEHPEYVAQKLNVVRYEVKQNGEFKVVLGKCKAIRAFMVDKDGKVSDVSENFGVERSFWFGKSYPYQYYPGEDIGEHKRSATYFPQRVFYYENAVKHSVIYLCFATRAYSINRFGSLADNINKKCVDYFKKTTYERYFNTIPANVLDKITGFFTDEPAVGGTPPWTDDLDKEFFKEHGYSLINKLYLLYDGKDERAKKLRVDYWKTTTRLFRERYIKNLKSACNKKGLYFIGHFEAEESPYWQALKCAAVYENLWCLDFAGFDSIVDKIGNKNNLEIFAGAKAVSSVSSQKELSYTFAECFAVNPFNFNVRAMIKIAGWLFIAGATVLIPHGFYYGYSGLRKYDAGKSFFYQDPYFKDFKSFSLFAERFGNLLSKSKTVRNTLLVYPDYEFVDYAFSDKNKFQTLSKKYFSLFGMLIENHIEFDISDCGRTIKGLKKGEIVIGKKSYKNVIYVNSDNPLMEELFNGINKSGVNLYKFDDEESFDLKNLKNNSLFVDIIGDGNERNINSLLKSCKEGKYLFLFNNCEKTAKISVSVKDKAYYYDIYNDGYLKLKKENNAINLSLEGFSFNALFITEKDIQTIGDYVLKEYPIFCEEYEKNPDWTYSPPIDVKHCLSEFNLRIFYQGVSVLEKKAKCCRIKEIYGANVKSLTDVFPKAVYDASEIKINNYPVRAEFYTEFYNDKVKTLLFDKDTFSGEHKIFFNDVLVDENKKEQVNVYDFNNYIINLEKYSVKGKNKLKIVFENAEENDGILTELYIL